MSGHTGGTEDRSGTAVLQGPEPGWSPGIMETLYNLLYRVDLGNQDLHGELERLEKTFGDEVYSELVYLLSHLRYSAPEARRHWCRVLEHRRAMEDRIGGNVDLRVALVSYFVEVNRQMEIPKIIELKIFEQTQASVYRDDLTDLSNFRYFREYLDREIHRCVRYNNPISLIMLDIDNFKNYNDRNGHEAGNAVLVTIAGLLKDSLRTVDVAARYGGEEFALILPATAKTDAGQVAERVRKKVADHGFPFAELQPDGKMTVSLGVATYPADGRGGDDLVRRADSALYFAKSNGKNQVHLFGQNRRSYQRIEARLQGTFQSLSATVHPFTTLNVSEGGILILADRNLPVGTLLKIDLKIPAAQRDIGMSGRVVRTDGTDTGIYEVGIRIIEIQAADWLLLSKYIGEMNPTRAVRNGRRA